MDAKAKVAYAIELPDGTIALGGWRDIGELEWLQANSTLQDGSRYVFAISEAVLAEALTERDNWRRSAEKQVERVVDLMAQQDRLLTDHEAALAELVEENAASEAICWRKCDELDARLQTTLTGLEALAGEWKKKWGRPDESLADEAVHFVADELLRTLTNSAKGGE